MKRDMSIPIKLILLPLTLSIFLFLLFSNRNASSSGAYSDRNTQPQEIKPFSITNKTKNMEILNVKRQGNEIQFLLKNNYQKTVTAYAIAPGGQHVITELSDEESLSPGATRIEKFHLGPHQSTTLSLLAVIFKDKTSDGDNSIVGEIKEFRLGKKTQYSRIVPYLNRLITTTDTEMPKVFKHVKTAINNLPDRLEPEINTPPHVVAGLHDAKETALRQLEEYEQVRNQAGNDAFKYFVTKLRDRFLRDIEIF